MDAPGSFKLCSSGRKPIPLSGVYWACSGTYPGSGNSSLNG